METLLCNSLNKNEFQGLNIMTHKIKSDNSSMEISWITNVVESIGFSIKVALYVRDHGRHKMAQIYSHCKRNL